jgi:[acyl-carrier-protein] S-malonyltransferase
MSRTLFEQFPYTKDIFEEASEAIKENLSKLTLEGPEDQLQLTAFAQPAILTTSFAWFSVLKRELDFKPASAAGHILGEYTSLLAAGAVNLTEAVRLVRLRGELMQTAVPEGKGKMVAVIGLTDEQVELLCQKATQGEASVVPANYNAPSQVVISGHSAAVDRALALGVEEPHKARKMVPLKVSAPFHSPLMKPVAEKFSTTLKNTDWRGLAFPIAFNVDGKVRDTADCASLLTEQLYSPVRWTKCASSLAQTGTSTFLEVGPGKVLTGLIKRIVPESRLISIDSIEEFKTFERLWRE